MTSILQKLQYKDQDPVLVLSSSKEFAPVLSAWKKLASVHTKMDKKTTYAFAVIFVTTPDDVKKLGVPVLSKLSEDAPIWFAYPKKTSKKYSATISRDEGWGPLGENGYETVRLIALDDDWSILRFRQSAKIKTMTRREGMALSKEGKAKTVNKKSTATIK